MTTWIGAKISALGERVVDSVLDAVASNQEQHLQQLQQLQHWTVARLLNRVVNAKYFYKQANVAPCEAFLNLHGESEGVASCKAGEAHASLSVDRCFKVERESPTSRSVSASALPTWLSSATPLGVLRVEAVGATGLLFSGEGGKTNPLLQRRQQQQQQLTWQVRVRFANSTCQSLGTKLKRRDGGAGSSSFGFNELLISGASFEFPVRDLWSDVVVELLCLRPKTHIIIKPSRDAPTPGAVSASSSSLSSRLDGKGLSAGPLPDFSAASAALAAGKIRPAEKAALQSSSASALALGSKDGASEASMGNKTGFVEEARTHFQERGAETANSSSGRRTGLSKETQSAATPRASEERHVYGRVIIPLSSFLRRGKDGDGEVEETLWAHLLPANEMQADPKFFRPVRGFEDFGMKNPQSSLGFLKLKLSFVWKRTPPVVSAVLSLTSPPAFLWLVPPSPEPQYLHSFSERLRQWARHTPLWRRKILNLADASVPRNRSDWILSSCWWLLCMYTCCFASFTAVPLLLALLIACTSLTYRFGALEGRHSQPRETSSETVSLACQDAASPSPMRVSSSEAGDAGVKGEYSSSSARPLPCPRSESFFSQHHSLGWSSSLWSENTGGEAERSGFAGPGKTAETEDVSFSDAYLRKAETDGGQEETYESARRGAGASDGPASPFLRSRAVSQPNLTIETEGTSLLCEGESEDFASQQVVDSDAESDSQVGEDEDDDEEALLSEIHQGLSEETGKLTANEEQGGNSLSSELKCRGTSVVQSPFGDIELLPKESGGRSVAWPVFADDEQEPSLASQIQDIVELASFLQLTFGHLVMALDKVKFAFNWSDPLLASGSLVLVVGNGLVLSLALRLCALFPLFVWRVAFFATFACATALRDLGACDRIAAFLLRRSEARLKADIGKRATGLSGANCTRKSAESASTLARLTSRSEVRLRKGTASARYRSDSRSLAGSSSSRTASCSRRQSSFVGGGSNVIVGRYLASSGFVSVLRTTLCVFFFFSSVFQEFVADPVLRFLRSLSLSYGALICFWWLHLPDQREVEHRQIAASQLLPSLDGLIPDAEKAETEETVSGSKLLSPSVLCYLKRYFRSRWERENPLAAHIYAAAPYLRPRSRSSSVGSSSAVVPASHSEDGKLQGGNNCISEETSTNPFSCAFLDTKEETPSLEQAALSGHDGRTSSQGVEGEEEASLTESRVGSLAAVPFFLQQPQDLQSREAGGGLRSLASLTAEGSVEQLADHPAFLELRRRLKAQQKLEHQREEQAENSDAEGFTKGLETNTANVASTLNISESQRGTGSGALSGLMGAIPGLEYLFPRKALEEDRHQDESPTKDGADGGMS